MEFTTYWSILDAPANSIKSNLIGLTLFLLGALLWFLAKKFKKDSGDGDRRLILFGTASFSFFGLVMFVFLTFIYKDNTEERITLMLNSSKASKVEGLITGFERTYRNYKGGRETTERFRVDSITFSYSDAFLGKFGLFGQTYNDVLYNGQYVRITYSPDTAYNGQFHRILKIEIAKSKLRGF